MAGTWLLRYGLAADVGPGLRGAHRPHGYTLDIEPTVGIDVENREGPVHDVRRSAIHDGLDEADLTHALSGKVGKTGEVFAPEHAHEGRAGQRVQRVVRREKQLSA